MSAPSSSVQFLELLKKSGLIDAQRLQAYLLRRQADGAAAFGPPRPGQRHGARRPADPLPGRTPPAGPVAALHPQRKIRRPGAARLRGHGPRLPVRTPHHAPPRGRQGAARRAGREAHGPGTLPPRGPGRRQAASSQHRRRLRRGPGRQGAFPGHGVHRRQHLPQDRQGSRADGPPARPPITSARPPWDCSMPSRPAWSTATSSPPTCCSTGRAWSKSSTWAWPASSARNPTI